MTRHPHAEPGPGRLVLGVVAASLLYAAVSAYTFYLGTPFGFTSLGVLASGIVVGKAATRPSHALAGVLPVLVAGVLAVVAVTFTDIVAVAAPASFAAYLVFYHGIDVFLLGIGVFSGYTAI